MAKKRERRTGNRAGPQSEADQPAGAESSSSSRANRDRKLITASTAAAAATTILFLVVVPAILVLVYRMFDAPNTPHPSYVYSRDLVNKDINYRQVLDEHMKTSENSSQRNFKNPVLAYITPWNSQGYDMAKKFSKKFSHLSPVWYELKSQGIKLSLEGRHNADKGWITEIKRLGNTQMLPRVVLEANPVDLLKKKKQRDKALKLIIAECKEMEYDGIVLESWSRWAAYGILHDPDMRNMALEFIMQLGQAMHTANLHLVYVIGPPHSDKLGEYDFGPEDLERLSDDVDGFSLMTYDFSSPQNPGPNAPLKWIQSTMKVLLSARNGERRKLGKKIFIGINFYGNDFVVSQGLGGGPIVGREYLSLLEQHRPQLHWESNSAEHFFLYTDKQSVEHVVFYPSLMSISVRLKEALLWDAGISIWEIGQGLEYNFDIL
ncbi:chitinase domain-containing protein [Striga asiatica]|uniref:Chitinase domain-containing protein 1 n=1 Tax=Striga asiatica TaxID=4170 RepID=A0A5A7P165_STRAF|nr:chitinase domain-containing protein [Striga asiatica]